MPKPKQRKPGLWPTPAPSKPVIEVTSDSRDVRVTEGHCNCCHDRSHLLVSIGTTQLVANSRLCRECAWTLLLALQEVLE